MDNLITTYLSKLEFGDLKQFKNVSVLPIFTAVNHSPRYITLKEALDTGVLTVTELSQGGSVPELKVENQGDVPVLLLDSEELMGAKQNRVLNTSILVREKAQTVIPVSCTEQGRWAYTSAAFSDSDTISSHSVRMVKHSSVTESLAQRKSFA